MNEWAPGYFLRNELNKIELFHCMYKNEYFFFTILNTTDFCIIISVY